MGAFEEGVLKTIIMRTKFIFLSIIIVSVLGCRQSTKRPEPNFYKNLYTEEIFNNLELEKFRNDLVLSFLDTIHMKSLLDSAEIQSYIDSALSKVQINFNFYSLIINCDSVIQPFNYDIRIGDEYIIRANSYEKIGMDISPQIFQTIDGDNIQIGGKQNKPTLINLWFVECRGCIAEIPALNRLQEKYKDKVDFVAITFENEKQVLNFLKRKEFNFKHIVNANDFIKQIATKPYPENIFIGKDGRIKHIEGGLSDSEDLDSVIIYFESILENMLKE